MILSAVRLCHCHVTGTDLFNITYTIMSEHRHVRSTSHDSQGTHRRHISPPPSQKFHPPMHIPSVPTPALLESVAGGAHYAGVNVEPGSVLKHRRSSTSRPHNVLKHDHIRVLDDLTELYCCRPTLEIFQRSWNKDAVFEDPLCRCKGYSEYAAQVSSPPAYACFTS